MIAEALQDKSANNQGSIAINETHAIQSIDKEICDATDQIIQKSVASVVVSHTEKLAGYTSGGLRVRQN
jgi:Skp family chaperone for outer membrane proteins